MTDLLPCPFCWANEGLYVQRMDGTILHPAYRVVCDNCAASTGYTDGGKHVEAWNTRPGVTVAEAAKVLLEDYTLKGGDGPVQRAFCANAMDLNGAYHALKDLTGEPS